MEKLASLDSVLNPEEFPRQQINLESELARN